MPKRTEKNKSNINKKNIVGALLFGCIGIYTTFVGVTMHRTSSSFYIYTNIASRCEGAIPDYDYDHNSPDNNTIKDNIFNLCYAFQIDNLHARTTNYELFAFLFVILGVSSLSAAIMFALNIKK